MGLKEGSWLDQAKKKGLISSSTTVRSADTSGTASKLSSSVLAALNEAEWQGLVVGFAQNQGWKVAHCRKVLVKNGKKTHWETTMPKGWFDLVLVRGGTYFVELKVRPNVPEPEQIEWANAMRDAGQSVRLWYPEHWQEVQDTLR